MELSFLLAKLFGIYFAIMGLSLLIKRNDWGSIVKEVMASKHMMFFAGFMSLILGSILILIHNVWTGPLFVVLITIFAWLTFIKGVSYFLLSHDVFVKMVRWWKGDRLIASGVLVLIIGLFFLATGFLV